jgi:hypothetical protein
MDRTLPRSTHGRILVGLLLAVMVAGCGLVAPADDGIPHPRGAQLVVRLDGSGGFVPVENQFTAIPPLTILGDGRVIVAHPRGEAFPGPAVPDIQVRRLTEAGLQTVLLRIAESGYLDESASWTGATMFMVDALTTLFSVNANDREVVVDVYGLDRVAAEGMEAELPADEHMAHEALAAVETYLLDLDPWIPAEEWADPVWQTYEPPAIRLLVGNVDNEEPNPDGSGGAPMEWPGTIPPAELGQESPLEELRCGVVAGAEASTWYAALREANELTRWEHDGHLYRVVPRPLLPDEDLTCGTLEG